MAATWRKLKKSLSHKLSLNSSDSSNSSSRPPRPPTPEISATVGPSPSSLSSSSSSAISKLSRSFSSRLSKKNCAICLSNVRAGQGQAIFTAECSHSFHFVCIANNVKHGNLCCPICRSKWNAVPFQAPTNAADPQQNNLGQIHTNVYHRHQSHLPLQPRVHPEPLSFSDDEPLPSTSPTRLSGPQTVAIKSYTEYSAIPVAESRPTFPVLVSIRAPPLQDANDHGRTPIDLVTVLDVSGSMFGTKLALLKSAVKFVIQNLGPYDRLSIVSFSTIPKRVFPLRRMTVDGRESAILAVESLRANGGTDIVGGLNKGVQVLEERRERNPVSSIILLSDGRDNCNYGSQTTSSANQVSEFLNQLPALVRCSNIPVHAFGFGTDHDAITMHAISDSSGGTFSFIESVAMIQDAFAMCIGGLLSVVAQELRLTVRSASQGVQIVSIPSGGHMSEISDESQQGVVNVGNMYAEEEKQFLVYLSVPISTGTRNREGVKKTPLLDVSCLYKDLGSNELIQVVGERVEILRPKAWSPADEAVCLEVDRQRNRILVAEGITKAQVMAEMGNLEGAQVILAQRRSTLLTTAAAQAGDGLCNWLEAELREIRDRMASTESYTQTGRAYVLSGLSSHSWQRATTRGDMTTQILTMSEGGTSRTSVGTTVGYETPTMVTMVRKSQNLGVNPAAQLQ
ncbi:unnamed protein product [Prunus brigantina]